MHYYKRNLGDYAKKAGRLSMLQHGSYTLLIDACYDREQFPTMDEAIEWSWASSGAEIEAVEFVLRKFFTLEDGRYVQARIKEEIDTYHQNAATNKRIADERETKRKENSTKRAQFVDEPPPNHEPLTTNHKPVTKNQEPRTQSNTLFEPPPSEAVPATVNPVKDKKPPKAVTPTAETWQAYSDAYRKRYNADPVRNVKVNGQLAQLVSRLGAEDAPHVAAWFLMHRHQFYVTTGHSVGALLRDCEKLRTEWVTGRQVTMTQAMQQDKTQTNFSVFDKLRQEAAIERERNNGE